MAQVEGSVGVSVGEGEERRKLGAGLELDFLTKAELSAELEPLKELLRRNLTRERPTIQELSNVGSPDGTGKAVIDIGAPSASRTWDVRRVVVAASPDATVVLAAAVVRLYRVEASNPTRLVDISAQVPAVGAWSRGQLNLKADEHLFVVVTGLAGGQQIALNVSAEETIWGAREQYTL